MLTPEHIREFLKDGMQRSFGEILIALAYVIEPYEAFAVTERIVANEKQSRREEARQRLAKMSFDMRLLACRRYIFKRRLRAMIGTGELLGRKVDPTRPANSNWDAYVLNPMFKR